MAFYHKGVFIHAAKSQDCPACRYVLTTNLYQCCIIAAIKNEGGALMRAPGKLTGFLKSEL